MIDFNLLWLTTSSHGAAMNWQGLSALLCESGDGRAAPFLYMEIVRDNDRSVRAFSQRKNCPFPDGIALSKKMSADDLAIMFFSTSFISEARYPKCDQFGEPGTWRGWEVLTAEFNRSPITVVQAVWVLAR